MRKSALGMNGLILEAKFGDDLLLEKTESLEVYLENLFFYETPPKKDTTKTLTVNIVT